LKYDETPVVFKEPTMSTVQTYLIDPKLHWVEPSTNELIRRAKQEAASTEAAQVLPEHLLYSIIMYGGRRVALMVNRLGLNWQQMYAGAAEIFDGGGNTEQIWDNLPLSSDAQECIDWALSFAAEYKHFLVYPEYLLLGVLRHPRIQPILGLIFTHANDLPVHLTEELGYAYSATMDQLIRSKVRDQVVIPFTSGKPEGILTSFSRPTLAFADLAGLDAGKSGLRNMVDFLKSPQTYQYALRQYNRGVMLIGYPCNDRTLLVRAAAGEALVPLTTLSMPVLLALLQEIAANPVFLDDIDLTETEQALLKQGEGIQRGRDIIHYVFEEARSIAPCMICINDIDAVERLENPDEREHLWNQLLCEIDGAEVNLPLGIIATAQHVDGLEERIVHPGRLGLQIVLTDSSMADPASPTQLCLSCKREVSSNWMYCAYCGAQLAKRCSFCGALLPNLEGTRFCQQCGHAITVSMRA
jgi:hypothetical protein